MQGAVIKAYSFMKSSEDTVDPWLLSLLYGAPKYNNVITLVTPKRTSCAKATTSFGRAET